ncbi:MAG: asparagine synthase (glutamine-hydrolyzing), partial [Pirellulales bacterium]
MCGIAGAIWTDARVAVTGPTLERMTDALRHRGPDEAGTYFNRAAGAPANRAFPAVAFGHRRLSIIDVEQSHQPLANEDETVWLVFNGEVYNYRELRRRLEGAGHRFRTAGDTETIVHLYEQEGIDFLQHLVGMFALALWDGRRRQLILARDRLGQNPLVYRQEADRLLFASELKGLLAVPGVPREIDPRSVDRYLTYQYVPHPETIFRGIHKLPPAHYGIYAEGRFSVRRYWAPEMNREVRRPFAESVERVRSVCREAVAMRMRSDVPLGAFLSGGIDSSVVVALMQEVSNAPVQTFSIGFTDKEYDESEWARRVAAHVGTEHHTYQVTPDSLEILPKLIWHFDEPFADSSAIPTFYVARWAREQVTVALTGDGGDELFCGYPRYGAMHLASRLDRLPRAGG